MLTSVLLFSSKFSKNSAAGLRALYFANNIFFPAVFLPSGLDTMQIYFHGGTFSPDFLSLHPSNQTATLICQQSEQLGLTPFAVLLGKCFFLFVSTISLSL